MNEEEASFPKHSDSEHCEVRRRITLVKRKLGGLGFLIHRNLNAIPSISNVVKGGEAEARGVQVGYVIETGGLSYNQIVDKLARATVGKPITISFKVIVKGKTSARTDNMESIQARRIENGTSKVPADEVTMNGQKTNGEHSSPDVSYNHGKQEKKFVKLQNWINNSEMVDTLHTRTEVSDNLHIRYFQRNEDVILFIALPRGVHLLGDGDGSIFFRGRGCLDRKQWFQLFAGVKPQVY